MRSLSGLLVTTLVIAPAACAQAPDAGPAGRLALGFAVDTNAVPGTWWGVDPALRARPAVVRFWRDYLAARPDPARRPTFWSAADRRRAADPDLALATEGYILGANAVLVEALPIVAGDSSRWVLRTVYVGGGTASAPGLLAMERTHVVADGGRWALAHPIATETAGWRRARVGTLEYVVHPSLPFDRARAAATATWAESIARRFAGAAPAPITYYLLPDLQAAARVMGLDWALGTDRVGGRANASARVVLAADPRYGEAYRHELAHVLLADWLGGATTFAAEGMAYWLGGARGRDFAGTMRDLAGYLSRPGAPDLRTILVDERSGAANSSRFPAAAALFELAHRRGGDAAVRRLADAARGTSPSPEAVAGALGMAPAVLEREWRALVASYARP